MLQASPNGDDEIVGTLISSGANGICQSPATNLDVQLIRVGSGLPFGIAIGPGPNGVLESEAAGDDSIQDGVRPGERYPYLPGFDARNQLGIAGQNNPEPEPGFRNHFLLRYEGQIYDPSYGTGPFGSDCRRIHRTRDWG